MYLTYFVAPLRCRNCGTVSAADETTLMESSLRHRDESALIRVGDYVDPQLLERRYLTIRAPKSGEPIRLLEMWTCPTCGFVNWGQVDLRDGLVERIESVTLDAARLQDFHYVTLSAGDELEARYGPPASDDGVLRPESVERLLQVLPSPAAFRLRRSRPELG